MAVRRERYWLHTLLLVLALITTTAFGARLAHNFDRNRPEVGADDLLPLLQAWNDPATLIAGLPFSLTLLGILMAHEMGHYITCLYYRIDASPPYFLPAPWLIGTLGAFIRIRSAICTKKELFDVGIAGPIAGFALVAPAMAIGLAYSKVIPGIATQGDLMFGIPLLERVLGAAVFPGVPLTNILVHPVARAAWVGTLATALNLLPIGQLDGGHIMYSFAGEWHRRLSQLFTLALLPLALYTRQINWVVWAVLLFFFALKHPMIYDRTPVSPGRKQLAVIALVMFVLCFTLAPIDMTP